MNLDTLFHWVREREAIRVRKDRGDPFPWTDDAILRDWRFCCVRREDDRVTRWIEENIRRPFEGHPYLWFMLCAARQLNWPPTLEALIGDPESSRYPGAWPSHEAFTPKRMGEALEDLASLDQKVFTGAYIVTAPSTKGGKKTTFVAEYTLGNLWRDRDKDALWSSFVEMEQPTLAGAHAALMRYDGWGPFLAYQAVVDMRFCPGLLADASDRHRWAAAGPGTVRGLNRVYGRHVDHTLTQQQALREMLPIYELIEAETGVEVDLSDVPNVLCETDKYERVKHGEGTPRARYVPGRGW